jgi:hypothetical protein
MESAQKDVTAGADIHGGASKDEKAAFISHSQTIARAGLP